MMQRDDPVVIKTYTHGRYELQVTDHWGYFVVETTPCESKDQALALFNEKIEKRTNDRII